MIMLTKDYIRFIGTGTVPKNRTMTFDYDP